MCDAVILRFSTRARNIWIKFDLTDKKKYTERKIRCSCKPENRACKAFVKKWEHKAPDNLSRCLKITQFHSSNSERAWERSFFNGFCEWIFIWESSQRVTSSRESEKKEIKSEKSIYNCGKYFPDENCSKRKINWMQKWKTHNYRIKKANFMQILE